MKWFIIVLKKYAQFSGRARRSEFWYYNLFSLIIALVLMGVDSTIQNDGQRVGRGLFYSLYWFASLVPSIAVGARRMHDVGKSGWFQLIPIYNLILACTEGDRGTNEYGPDPKQEDPYPSVMP